jgi:hypothetical protein
LNAARLICNPLLRLVRLMPAWMLISESFDHDSGLSQLVFHSWQSYKGNYYTQASVEKCA